MFPRHLSRAFIRTAPVRTSIRTIAAHRTRGNREHRSSFFNARPFAAAAVCLVAVAHAASSSNSNDNDDEFVEPASGFAFKRRLADGSRLISASTRTITFLKFHAYAVGFYTRGPVQAPADGAALSSVLDSPANGAWMMEIRPCRETVGNHLTSAWLPKLTKLLEPLGDADSAQLAQLAGIMNADKRKFAHGSAITLVWDKRAHTLHAAHNGAPLGTVSDADRVARALFTIYFELPSISDDFRRGLVNQQQQR